MLDSGFAEFKIDYLKIKDFAIGAREISESISVGGHPWRIFCYPRGRGLDGKGEYLSIFLQLASNDAKNVRAIFEAFLTDKDGAPSSSVAQRCAQVYPPPPASVPYTVWGWPQFVKSSDLDPLHVRSGVVTITWGVIVSRDGDAPIAVPPSDIGGHLGCLLDRADGSDVSFVVDEETFPAHRAVLAARSPVFRAQLHGSMADATMPSITLHDINAATFKAMLRFIYTDDLPADGELTAVVDSPTEMLHELLVVADRYALDRLKLLCASRIWENVSVDTVGNTLCLAEMYNCPELKNKCITFLAQEGNFQKAALTDGFLELVQKFPSVLAELRQKFGA